MAPKKPRSREVLIVEDDAAVCHMLARHLERRGYKTSEAGDAREGLARLKRGGADLVILDNNLPGMMGLEALPRFCELGVPVIMITGYPSQETFKDALLLGAKTLLVKPLNFDELFAKIAEFLKS